MSRKTFDIIEFFLLTGILIFCNIIFSRYFFRIDLTQDGRYSVSESAKDKMKEISDVIFVEVFLEGELTPDYNRLKKAIREKLSELRLISKNKVEFKFINPNGIHDKKLRDQFFTQLIQKGIQYKYERIEENGKVEEKLIFPSALLSYKGREVPVMFLKGSKVLPLEEQLNQAVEGVEYEILSAIRKLDNKAEKSLAFVEGQGEWPKENVSDISSVLSQFYSVDRISLSDSINLNIYKTLILAGPTKPFSEKEKFILDQYVINGGNLLIAIDALNLNADSLLNGYTYAFPFNTGIEDILFKFGIRLNNNIIQDLNSAVIKVSTGVGGQTEVVNWPYHPIIYNYGKHSIVKNLDAVVFKYVGNIDTVKAVGITKTPLLFTGSNTKITTAPAKLDLNETRNTKDASLFNQGIQCVGYLLEGRFQSSYRLRPSPVPGRNVVSQNAYSKVIIVSDAEILKNDIDKVKNKPLPLGYDANIQYEFSNKDFLVNAVDYLMDERIVNIRGKEIKLRPLDKIRISEEKTKWQLINLVLPVFLIIIFGFIRNKIRINKYTKGE